MNLDDLLIGFTIMFGLFAAGVFVVGGFRAMDHDVYNNTAEFTAFNTTYAKLDRMYNQSNKSMYAIANSGESSWGDLGVLAGILNLAWTQLKSIPTTFSLMFSTVTESATTFGVPMWAVALVATILCFTILFGIIYLIVQGAVR